MHIISNSDKLLRDEYKIEYKWKELVWFLHRIFEFMAAHNRPTPRVFQGFLKSMNNRYKKDLAEAISFIFSLDRIYLHVTEDEIIHLYRFIRCFCLPYQVYYNGDCYNAQFFHHEIPEEVAFEHHEVTDGIVDDVTINILCDWPMWHCNSQTRYFDYLSTSEWLQYVKERRQNMSWRYSKERKIKPVYSKK